MTIGKTIRIYLNDGSVSGIRHAEIVNWTGQAVSAPRTKIKHLSSWNESKKPGVYFLFGVDENTGDEAVYIGEAENVFDRLQNHIVNKDFWNTVVFFTSKDENLTKSHVKYLESRLVELAKLISRNIVLNANNPQIPSLPRGDRDAMDEFIANLKILLGVVGYKTLESLELTKPTNIPTIDNSSSGRQVEEPLELFFNVKDIYAEARLTDEGLIVLSGSFAAKSVQDSLSVGYRRLREKLIDRGVLELADNKYLFTKNQLFKNPSPAAAIIAGCSMNGRECWKTKKGKSLKSIEEPTI